MTDGNIFFKKKKRKIQEHMKNKTQHLMCVLVAQSCPTVTPWTVAPQAPLSMGFSRQESWSRLSFPSPGDLTNPGIEPGPPALQADSLPSERAVNSLWHVEVSAEAMGMAHGLSPLQSSNLFICRLSLPLQV